jgi:RNA-directed DNA polymerase
MRQGRLRCRVAKRSAELARMCHPMIRGGLTDSTRYDKAARYPTLQHLDRSVARWAMAKEKRLRRHRRRAAQGVRRGTRRPPGLCAHWRLLHAGAEREEPEERSRSRPDL